MSNLLKSKRKKLNLFKTVKIHFPLSVLGMLLVALASTHVILGNDYYHLFLRITLDCVTPLDEWKKLLKVCEPKNQAQSP